MFEPRSIEEQEFVKTPFFFSYSSLNKLSFSPRAFYAHYILKQREEKPESFLIEGKLIHALLLEKDKFDDNFIISPSKIPNPNIKELIDYVYYQSEKTLDSKLIDYTDCIIDYLKQINLYQTLKTDQQRLDKINTSENQSYFEFLKIKESKIIVSQETYNKCVKGVEIIKEDKVVKTKLITETSWELLECLNEIELKYFDKEQDIGFKGVLDNLVIDYQNKVVLINDLKTTSKSIGDFEETVQYYNYWLQAAMYYKLVSNQILSRFKDQELWRIEFNFIVYDAYEQVYCFPVSNETMELWTSKFIQRIEEAKYHLNSGDFTLPYRFAMGNVTL